MEIEAAKFIGAGLAAVGIGLAAVGVGIAYAMAPDKAKATGVMVTAGFGVACLLLALVTLFG